ncbi:MAG: F-box protein [Candidatus Aenigmatarchaeota archaeon]
MDFLSLPNEVLALIIEQSPSSYFLFSQCCRRLADICYRMRVYCYQKFVKKVTENFREYYVLPNGNFDGPYIEKYKSGVLKAVCFYDNGRIDGKYVEYYENGKAKEVSFYDHGKMSKEKTLWYENGKMAMQSIIKDQRIEQFVWDVYGNLNGNIIFDVEIKNNKYVWPSKRIKFTEWYENGNKEKEGTVVFGCLEGRFVRWYSNGNKKELLHYKNGKIHGKKVSWYHNGQKKMEGYFKNGLKNGKFTYWRINGEKIITLFFKNDAVIIKKIIKK